MNPKKELNAHFTLHSLIVICDFYNSRTMKLFLLIFTIFVMNSQVISNKVEKKNSTKIIVPIVNKILINNPGSNEIKNLKEIVKSLEDKNSKLYLTVENCSIELQSEREKNINISSQLKAKEANNRNLLSTIKGLKAVNKNLTIENQKLNRKLIDKNFNLKSNSLTVNEASTAERNDYKVTYNALNSCKKNTINEIIFVFTLIVFFFFLTKIEINF